MLFQAVQDKIKKDLTTPSENKNNMITAEPGLGVHHQLRAEVIKVAQELNKDFFDVSSGQTYPASHEFQDALVYLDVELSSLKEGFKSLRSSLPHLPVDPVIDHVDRLMMLSRASAGVLVLDAKDVVLDEESQKLLEQILNKDTNGLGVRLGSNVSVVVSTTPRSQAHASADKCQEFEVPTPSLADRVKLGRTLHAPPLTAHPRPRQS